VPKSRQGGAPPSKGEPGKPPKTCRSSRRHLHHLIRGKCYAGRSALRVGNIKNNNTSLIEPIVVQ
jgi:hypothetical protein